MYHGIIQEGQWTQKGTYLRTKIEQYQLDKVIGLGRIWRISHQGYQRDKEKPRMFDETPAQLIKHLEHPNGWWRDKAQQLIVLSKDISVAPGLESMARKNNNLLARFHALWSLEGLGVLNVALINDLLKDPNPRMRIQAMRASEGLYKNGNRALGETYFRLMEDPDADVAIQAILTGKYLGLPELEAHIKRAMKANPARGVQVVGDQILNPETVQGFGSTQSPQLTDQQQEVIDRGAVIFNELCVQCHGADGTGTALGNGTVMAPSLRGNPRLQAHPEYVTKVIMRGLEGPLDGKTYPAGIMVANSEQSDDWIASIASFIRLGLTNEASMVSPEDVAAVRARTEGQTSPYKFGSLMASVPQALPPGDDWKITASHSAPTRIGGTASPKGAFNFEGWTTGEQQKTGMWYQIEFPKTLLVTELHFNAPPVRKGWGPNAPDPIQTYPRSYKLEVSSDQKSWKQVAAGACEDQDVMIVFEPVEGRFLKITLTGEAEISEDEIPWSMRQLKVYGYASEQNSIE
jgi:mono/diheme cytochrome c family protein